MQLSQSLSFQLVPIYKRNQAVFKITGKCNWCSLVGATVMGSSSLSCSSVAMDKGISRTRPRLVPTHRHGVGRASDLRPYDSANCSVVTASLVSRSILETLELRDRLNEFSRLSVKKGAGSEGERDSKTEEGEHDGRERRKKE